MKKRNFLGIMTAGLGVPQNLFAASYKHPGVYIDEISQPAPILGVTTNTVGFVGITEKGVDPSGQNPGLYHVPTMITGWNQFRQTYGDIIWNRHLAAAVYAFFQQGGMLCYVVRLEDEGGAAGSATIAGLGTIHTTSTGGWSAPLSIEITNSPPSASKQSSAFTLNVVYTPDPKTPPANYDGFIAANKILPREDSSYVLERFGGLSVPANVDGSKPDQIAQVMAPMVNRIASQSLFIRLDPDTKASPSRPANTGANPIPIAGGKSGNLNYGSAAVGTQPAKGFHAFSSLQDDTVNLMAIPDLPTLADKSGAIDKTAQAKVIRDATSYCKKRMSMFFIADPPAGLSPTGMQEYKRGTKTKVPLTSDYGAIYYPWLTVNKPGTAANITVPPSGAVAGVYAATDTAAGVWKAPAGVTEGRIPFALGLERNVTDAEQGELNPHGINAIRQLPGFGTVVWGARTLSIDTEWTYVNVRRLFIYLESSIKRATWWLVFEPNTPKLWGTVNRNLTAFLADQWQQGALFGATANEAFFVKIDEDNNPPEQRNKGVLHIDIGVAPVFPSEFVIISFQQKTLTSE